MKTWQEKYDDNYSDDSFLDNNLIVCDGCNIREPWEHRCHGKNCQCDNLVCIEKQDRITHNDLMIVIHSEMKS